MIPLLLSIRNFMCYGTNVPDLNLENIHVACLSGNNGHGKTAILDSITWVLWGKSRTRTQEELVHQGQESMTVEMEFSSQSQRYRVTRTLSISKSGANKTELNLSVIKNGSAVSIMGDTIRDTEQKIIELIHMDYDTFISTSYLKQGDSNHFTKARPNERKKILAEVLDLAYYEKLEVLAKEKSRELKSEISKNEMSYERDMEATKGKATFESMVTETTSEINLLSSEEKNTEKQSYDLRSKIGSLQQLSKEESELKKSSQNNVKQIDDIEKQIQEWDEQINSLHELTSRKEEINQRKNELAQATNTLKSSSESRTKIQALKLQQMELKADIALEQQNIIHQLEQLKTKKFELDKSQALANDIQRIMKEQKTKLAPILHEFNSLDINNPELESIMAKIGAFTEENAVLKKNMEDTRSFHDMLEAHSSDCPLCRQPLSQSSEQLLQSQYETKGKESRRKFDHNIKEISKLKQRYEFKKSAISTQLATLSENKAKYERGIAINANELSKHQNLATEIPENNIAIQHLTNVLETKRYAENAQLQSKKLTESISKIAFNEDHHQKLESKIDALTPFLRLHGQLEQAEDRTTSLTRIKESQRKVLDTTREVAERSKKRLRVITKDIESLPTLESEWTQLSKKIETYRDRLQGLRSKKEHAQYQLETIGSLEPKLLALNTKMTQQKEDSLIYDELTAAFGKNGVQALMIERAVPQIEENANELLSKLTDNKMNLELELQEGRVDRLTGLPSEELVINISGDTGTRSYESFSGGETFRIDFAIRIALSRLLAVRAGAPLPILFIDEGFGSQDSEGQERLTEAIQSIQTQFEKIIVITHIDQMKENFEERIEVVKEATGSTFSLA